MNTFFRISIFLCIALLVFTLLISFVDGIGAFPYTNPIGIEIGDTGTLLEDTTTLERPNMDYLWLLVIGGIFAGLAFSARTQSIVPAGLFIFASVFWALFINTISILSIGGWIPGEILTIFTACTTLIFIAAAIGMLTGSG